MAGRCTASSPRSGKVLNDISASSRPADEVYSSRYEDAIQILMNRRQFVQSASTTPSGISDMLNASPLPNTSAKSGLRGRPRLEGMKGWLKVLGHSGSDLQVIHVAGTKGKGATCMFSSAILLAHGSRTGFPNRVGLYTSPHLLTVRERIRINSNPISESLFAEYFFQVWDLLKDLDVVPRFMQLLTLVSIHTFISENVDVAIYETHSGGEYDSTRVLQPTVTGLATIGFDHVRQLGPSIENIAWHKAGIFHNGSPSFSVPQEPGARKVLFERAIERSTSITFVDVSSRLPTNIEALRPDVQKLNCSLAIALVDAFLSTHDKHLTLTLDDIRLGAETYVWPGRFHQIQEDCRTWCLDGAHNELSMPIAAKWFADCISDARLPTTSAMLIFKGPENKDRVAIFARLVENLKFYGVKLDHFVFTSCSLYDNSSDISAYVAICGSFYPDAGTSVKPTVENALAFAQSSRSDGLYTLITGSLELVGDVLGHFKEC